MHGDAAFIPLDRSPIPERQTLGLPPADAGEIAIPDGQFWIRVDETRPDPEQPRKWFDPTEMAIFAAGLAEFGQQNPVWARRLDAAEGKLKYEAIDGERRWRACRMNGTSHLLAVFKRPKDKYEKLEQQAIANFGRANHPPLEIANMIERLRQKPGLAELSHSAQMQKLTGVFCQSVGWVTYHHSMLKLHPSIQAKLNPALPKKQQLATTMAAFLATTDNHEAQLRILKEVETQGLSVKQARNFARKLAAKRGLSIGAKRTPVDDFRPFRTYLRRDAEDLEIYLDMPDLSFNAMIKSRRPEEIEAILKSMKDRSQKWIKLCARIATAAK